jgi:hypothetical protein
VIDALAQDARREPRCAVDRLLDERGRSDDRSVTDFREVRAGRKPAARILASALEAKRDLDKRRREPNGGKDAEPRPRSAARHEGKQLGESRGRREPQRPVEHHRDDDREEAERDRLRRSLHDERTAKPSTEGGEARHEIS